MIDYNSYKLDFSKFNLSADQFDQQSYLHGIKHTYRVMLHCLRLGYLLKKQHEGTIAFFGAYIHDMARLHDGYCTIHGADSAKYKLPLYQNFFMSNGATTDDIKLIQQIVTRHSIHIEPPRDHPVFLTLSILKDADALDRIRLGENDLNPDYLRHEITTKSISFGEDLFYETNNEPLTSFAQVIEIANKIEDL